MAQVACGGGLLSLHLGRQLRAIRKVKNVQIWGVCWPQPFLLSSLLLSRPGSIVDTPELPPVRQAAHWRLICPLRSGLQIALGVDSVPEAH